MTKQISIFSSPFMLGFEEIERTLDKIARSGNDSYPPYNIEQTSDYDFKIVIAVAGFTMEDLSVQIEQNQLVIRGKRDNSREDEEKSYLHRGIATRQFHRSFVLADDIEVQEASLENGLLSIGLRRIMPEITVQKIEIKNGEAGTGQKALTHDKTAEDERTIEVENKKS